MKMLEMEQIAISNIAIRCHPTDDTRCLVWIKQNNDIEFTATIDKKEVNKLLNLLKDIKRS